MTTALIGNHGARTAKARVALLSRQGGTGLASALSREGHELIECRTWEQLVAATAEHAFDLVLCDDDTAPETQLPVDCPVVTLGERRHAGQLAIPHAAIESGLDTILALAVSLAQTSTRCRELARVVDGIRTGTALVGRSPAIRRVHSAISRAADSDATVLVEGPTGAGKSLVARMIHCKSRRSNRNLVVIDGATATAEGLGRSVEEARGSTLLVEDVDRLPANVQAILVKHLKERPAATAGGTPRLVVTTATHLPELVARGAFREDLFYRLHAMPIAVPSLRERSEDIALLAQAVLESTGTSGRATSLSAAALQHIEAQAWPGNVAQLESCLRRAQCLAGGNSIEREHVAVLPPVAGSDASPAPNARAEQGDEQQLGEDAVLPFEQEEQRMLTRALRATKGNVRRAAQLLGIGRATLYRKIQQYNLRLQ